jgi:hypothetical protein
MYFETHARTYDRLINIITSVSFALCLYELWAMDEDEASDE